MRWDTLCNLFSFFSNINVIVWCIIPHHVMRDESVGGEGGPSWTRLISEVLPFRHMGQAHLLCVFLWSQRNFTKLKPQLRLDRRTCMLEWMVLQFHLCPLDVTNITMTAVQQQINVMNTEQQQVIHDCRWVAFVTSVSDWCVRDGSLLMTAAWHEDLI